MVVENKKFTLIEKALVFICVLFKYLITYGINKNILYLILLFIVFLTLITTLKKKLYLVEFNKLIFFGFIALIFILFYSDQNFLISYLLAILCLRKFDKEFIKIFFFSSIFCFSITIVFNKIGLIASKDMVRYVDGVVVNRFSLGFSHPNELFLFFLAIVLSGYYLYKDKIIFYLVTFIFSIIFYKLSLCRTGFFTVIIFFIIVLVNKKISIKKFRVLLPYIIPFFTFLSLFIAYKYGNDITNKISDYLTGRPFYWNFYLKSGTMFSMFGHNKVEGMFLDNFYIYMLVQYGIFGYLIYTLIYYKSTKKMKFDVQFLIIIIIFLIYGLVEANVIIGSIQFLFALQLKYLIEYRKEDFNNGK